MENCPDKPVSGRLRGTSNTRHAAILAGLETRREDHYPIDQMSEACAPCIAGVRVRAVVDLLLWLARVGIVLLPYQCLNVAHISLERSFSLHLETGEGRGPDGRFAGRGR